MTQFSDYLATEVVEDYSDGIIPRREALRRLALLGVSVAVAAPLLAACGAPAAPDSRGSSAAPPASPAGPSALPTEAITFDGPESRTLQAAWAAADEPQGAVLVVHENRGLTDHIRSVTGRLAASGYSALAIDLLSAEGGTGSFADEGEVTAALNAVPDSRFIDDMKAAIDELQRRASVDRVGAVGFCFGGGMVWTLLAAGEPRLGRRRPVLRSATGRRGLRGLPECRRARYLRRAGRPGQRQP